MIGTPTVVILLLTQSIAAVITVLTVAAIAVRAVRQRLAARSRAAGARAVPLILQALDDVTGDVGAVLDRHGAVGRRLDAAIIALVPKLRGADRELLVDILRRRGTIDAARRGTRSVRPIRRLRSVELLGALALPENLPDLAPRLKDRNADVRRAAVRAMGRTASADAVPALLDVLDSDTRLVADHSLTLALVRVGPAAVPALTEALTAGGPRARSAAASVLGWLADSQAVAALIAAADSEDSQVAMAAIEALGRMDSAAAAKPLQDRLGRHEPPQVRTAAANALGRLGHRDSVDLLAELLWEEHDLARTAAMSLNRLGPAGLQVLESHAEVVPEAREALASAYRRTVTAGAR
jgi:HEAT repeat protein